MLSKSTGSSRIIIDTNGYSISLTLAWGMATPFPIDVEPSFSRSYNLLKITLDFMPDGLLRMSDIFSRILFLF